MSDELSRMLRELKQDHLLPYTGLLDSTGRSALLEDVRRIDGPLLRDLAHACTAQAAAGNAPPVLEPAATVSYCRPGSNLDERRQVYARGEDCLAGGTIALFLVAGGQGTRLGFDGPKGCFPVSPVRRKSLFQLFAEQVAALRRRYGRPLPWYIMTSPSNDAKTRCFFRDHDWFGLAPGSVHFIVQAHIPSLDEHGRLLVGTDGAIFRNPDGHGGAIYALQRSGALEEMLAQGIENIFYFQVDNPLARIADPLFVGAHSQNAADMSTKVVEKNDPNEKVGIIGRINSRLGCIEYSELPPELATARDAGGRLRFNSANIAIHMLKLEFVEKMACDPAFHLPYHIARKDIDCLQTRNGCIVPATVRGCKCEMFIFDALGFARRALTLEVDRGEEFSPVKNADGADSPETARCAMSTLHRCWLEQAAGTQLPDDFVVEISPLRAGDLAKADCPGNLTSPVYIE